MKKRTFDKRLALHLSLLPLLLCSTVRAQNFDGWTPPETGTNALSASLTGSFVVKGPDTGSSPSNQWRVLLEGRDIYGNTVAIPLDQGTIQPLLGGEDPQTATINFSGPIPNDGTLYNVSDSGYRLNLYFGTTNVSATSAGDLQAGQSGYLVDVTPDLAIPGPPVTPITKIRATGASATLTGTEITAITITNPGQGYDPFKPPTVTFTPPGAEATAIIDPETGSVVGFNILSGGSYGAPPTVTIASPPSYLTQRTGGVLYGYNEQTGQYNYAYNSGDTVRFQTTIRNNATGSGTLQSRPMRTRTEDEFRLRTVLTVDPAYTGAAGDDDLLVFDQTCYGDMAFLPTDLSEVRTTRTYRTPAAVPVYGLPVTAPGSVQGAATAVPVGGRIDSFTGVTGSGYDALNPPPVVITGDGTGASAQAVVDGSGNITAINVTSPGRDYTTAVVTIPAPRYGARYYQPLPDDGFLDIGEEVQVGYDVLMPQRYPGIYFVAARVDALDQIAEPVGGTPGRETPPLDPDALVNNNTFVSDVATRVQILSGPGPGIATISQVTDSSGNPLIQSDGFSDMPSVSEDGGFVAFESYARDLAVSQSEASSLLGPTLTGFPPLWNEELAGNPTLAAGLANGKKQIFRRNTATRQIEIISVSSSGEQAGGDALNASITANGRQVAFESRAANLVPNDTGGSSDIFVRRLDILRTVRVSVDSSGIQGNGGSFTPSISGNGRFVAFASVADNLDPSNPKQDGAGFQQIYVHDRDVSGSGTYDAAGNVRTYLASVTPIGSASAATATATVSGGKVTGVSVTSGGAEYIASAPPAVFLTGGGGSGARAKANVSGKQVVSVTITEAGAGYTSAPTVTIAPSARAANGWSDTPKISEEGNYLTFVSYSSNLPQEAGGSAIGDAGWQGVVYRVQLFQGAPVVNTMQPVSVDDNGNLANALSYEPVINGDGSRIAYTSMADNLVSDDSNGVADVFVRDFTNNKTIRASESLNRLAFGSITFPAAPSLPQTPPANIPEDGDEITLGDGVSPAVTFTFRNAPALADDVLIGATAAQTRDNLVSAINIAASGTAPRLSLRAVADSPANPNPFYTPNTRTPGQSYAPSLFLINTTAGAKGNVEITGNFTITESVDGVSYGAFANGNLIATTGMGTGGTQAEDDAGNFDGVPGGSTMPSIDRSGMVVAFRSTMQTLDVFNRTYNGLNGLRNGDLMRMLRNASGNVFVRVRDVDGEGGKDPDASDNVDTKRVSVNKFGYATYKLANLPSSGNSHKPAVSALGRYIAFSSDAENNGGLAFGRTNLDPQDNNGYRDIYLYDRDVTAEPPVVVVNNPPDVTLTEPSWLSGRELSVGSTITLNALVTDADEDDSVAVTFFVNGEQIPAQAQYGNYFSAQVRIATISASNVIQARAQDDSGAENDSTTSAPITFASVASIAQPTSITMVPVPRGTLFEVGQPVELTARVTLPGGAALWGSAFVRFYANGVLIGSDGPYIYPANNVTATITWYPSSAGPATISAVASTADYFFATTNERVWATLYSNELPSVTVLGVNESAPTGTPEQIVVSIFQTVLSRPPTGTENSYWVDALSTGAVTPAGMVIQLVSQTEYNDLQNTLFGYYYRLNTTPSSDTYLRNLNAMETTTTPLPGAGQPTAANGTIASPYGATVGDATAAQFIIESAAFATANPGVQTLANNQFLLWYYARWGEQLGLPTELTNAMSTYTPQAERLGYATALVSALFYAARDQTAFDYQLKATSLEWLFTGVWSAPTIPAVTTQSDLEAFVNNLVDSSLGVPTWSWVDANGLSGKDAEADSDPAGDGISNLMKYAFNMDPNVSAYTGTDATITPTGTRGLPLVRTVASGGLPYLEIVYVRRISDNSVTYTPQFTSSLDDPLGWEAVAEPDPEPIDSVWERVTVRDSLPVGSTPSRFGRLRVNASYWTTPQQQEP